MRWAPHTALALLLSTSVFSAPRHPAAAEALPVPVVVELFTSEGCSSCPPADALLAQLDRTQPVAGALIIPLEEHVDYWDSLGWRDPFSSADFTARQVDYARQLRLASPYTPQMVVAGHWNVSGNASRDALAAIAAAARTAQAEVVLTLGGPATSVATDAPLRITITAKPLPESVRERAKVWLAVTEDGLTSQVSAGENSGRHLEHRAVVRKLLSAGRTEPGRSFDATVETRLGKTWKRENLRVVVFLAGSSTGQVFGAATTKVNP